ncbi:MAG: MaoC family dehydratase, partial [Planctomycetota bacterium]
MRLTLSELTTDEPIDLGAGDWIEIDHERICRFGDVTEDRQWIHMDRERAAEGPFGRPIAHGLLTLSLIFSQLFEMFEIADAGLVVNYGFDRVRYPAPVPEGSRIRLHAKIVSTEPKAGGTLCHLALEWELEGSARP